MTTITDIRKKYPQYNDLSDQQLADALHTKHYSDLPKSDFYRRVGLKVGQPQESSFLEGVWQGARVPFNNAARALETGAEKIGVAEPLNRVGRALGMAGSVAEAEAAQEADARDRNLKPSPVGKFLGGMAGGLVAAAATRNPWALGAAEGALSTSERTPGGVLKDAAAGAVIGKVADTAVEGVARVVSPKVREGVRKLVGEGVELTPGEILGGAAKRIEEKAASVPILGDFIRGAKSRSIETFNRAATNRSLKPIGEKLPDDVPTGHDAVRWAGDRLSEAYQSLLPKISAPFDKTLATRLNHLRQRSNLPKPQAERLEQIIQSDIHQAFNPNTAVASGRKLKALDEKLRRYADQYSRGGPDERELASSIRDLQEHMRSLVRRSNPKYAKQLRAIDQGWANLIRVENAAKNTADGMFTPNQFKNAVRQSTGGRKRAVARGEALAQDLARAGVENLSPEIPNSGTPDRIFQAGVMGAGAAIEPSLLLAAGAASLPYSPVLRPGVRWLMTGRQGPRASTLADYVRKGKLPAAMAAPVLLQAPKE